METVSETAIVSFVVIEIEKKDREGGGA